MSRLRSQGDLVLLAGVALVVGLVVLPLPPAVLDALLTLQISVALTVLMVTLYCREALEFSAFPSVLLMVTLLRLSLNIAGTRMILLHGYAGEVIQSFGQFVVGGNYVVGVVVFIILVIIQFVVITNGAGRVAEVAARFTLDALPGKQMSIDADVSAGMITQEEAQERRRRIEQEADFYGAMDGAAKFVKGDAIAAVVIILVNIAGGFAVGVGQKGMPLAQALGHYTLLTVGEGLVTQLPALLVSTAAGIIVTRSAASAHLGEELLRQVVLHPPALRRLGWLLMVFGLLPGIPKLPFWGLALGALVLARKGSSPPPPPPEKPSRPTPEAPEEMTPLLDVEPLELEVGYALVELLDAAQGGDLLQRVVGVRRACARELGVVVPPIRIRDELELPPRSYRIRLFGQTVAEGEVYPGRYLAMGEVSGPGVEGIEVREPAFGLPATWIPEAAREEAELQGCTVVEPASVIATHLSETLRRHAAELLGRQEVQTLLDHLGKRYPGLVSSVVPGQVSLALLRQVLQRLVREQVSVRDLRGILEVLADHAGGEPDPVQLTEKVREALGRSIVAKHTQPDGSLPAVTLDPEVEALLAEGLAGLPPERARAVVRRAREVIEALAGQGIAPVVLCSQRVRPVARALLERPLAHVAVLSYEEIPPGTAVDTLGVVALGQTAVV